MVMIVVIVQMPKEYMSRLVFDGNHASLLMYRKKEESSLIGGCCFRPFKERGFAEIVFLAVNQYEQVIAMLFPRGYFALL